MPKSGNKPNGRLNGWKEIASYIGKSTRTAQRWEEEFGLPVHRIGRGNSEIIFAFQKEIDEWQGSTERLRFESLEFPKKMAVVDLQLGLDRSRQFHRMSSNVAASGLNSSRIVIYVTEYHHRTTDTGQVLQLRVPAGPTGTQAG